MLFITVAFSLVLALGILILGISIYQSTAQDRIRKKYLDSLQQQYDEEDDEEDLNDFIYDLDLSNHSNIIFHDTVQ